MGTSQNIDTLLRPPTIDTLYMSDAEKVLKDMMETKNISHSFCITGPSGMGKTTLGRALASYLFSNSSEEEYDLQNSQCYIEVNGSKYTGIDNMRELLDSVQ